jgi:hypothetical protein
VVGFGATPQGFKLPPRAFLEVWNLFAIEKGSKNFKFDFHNIFADMGTVKLSPYPNFIYLMFN